jgi:RNA polymerase sigma-70 factor (ECF subfamily)
VSIIPLPSRDASSQTGARRESAAPAGRAQHVSLALRISQDDTVALGELIDHFWIPLTSYASRILDDMSAAEDVVQEVFVRIWKRRTEWPPRSVKGFLFRTTRNLALDALRSRDARRERERSGGRELLRRPRTADGVLKERELSEVLDRAIQSLPERRREAFTLAYFEHLSYEEISAVMDISPRTVGRHISSALTHLREVLHPLLGGGAGVAP